MPFRSRGFRGRSRRRFRAKWDMQTFQDCNRGFLLQGEATCAVPLLFADYVCGMERASGTVIQAAGAGRALRFGGGHRFHRYGVDASSGQHAGQPCLITFGIVTALVILPLFEGSEITPAYIPNLLNARSQLSVVTGSQSDTMDRVLWRTYNRVVLLNAQGTAAGSAWPCTTGASTDQWELLFTSAVAALNANTERDPDRMGTVKARARLDEKHALYLTTQIEWGSGVNINTEAPVTLFREFYLRFAVRPGR